MAAHEDSTERIQRGPCSTCWTRAQPLQEYQAHQKTPPPQETTVGLCLGPCGGPWGWGSQPPRLRRRSTFIVSHGIIKGKGLQFPGTNFEDKTLNPPESSYKTTFLVLSRIWYKICTRAWSPFPLIIPWKTMNLSDSGTSESGCDAGYRMKGSGVQGRECILG